MDAEVVAGIERDRAKAEIRAARNAGLDAKVRGIVLEHFTRDAEFVLRELRAGAGAGEGALPSLNAVRESIRGLEVIRALRGLPATRRKVGDDAVVYSNIVAGRHVRDQNYACRLFQFDLVRIPSVKVVNGKLVADGTPRNVLTGICVGSRHAFARVLDRDAGKSNHPLETTTRKGFKDMYTKDILPAFVARQAAEARRVAGGYYTEARYLERCAARRAARDAAVAGRNRRGAVASLAQMDLLPLIHGGPGRLERVVEGKTVTFVERAVEVATGPFVRPLGPEYGQHSWLDGLAELTMSAGARREVSAPWEQTHVHMTMVTDAGDFGETRAYVDAERAQGGHAPVRWCVVSKSQLNRLSVQIIERFHRTLRSMLAIYFYAHDATVGLAQAIERVLRTYNATRHATTLHRPADLWDCWDAGAVERYSAQVPKYASLAAFPVGSYVEVLEGKVGKLDKQVVKRATGLRVVAHNQCTLELERVFPVDEDDEDATRDAVRAAAVIGPGAAVDPDDELMKLHGVGPKYARDLHALGVDTLAQLAQSAAGQAALPPAARVALPFVADLVTKIPRAEMKEHERRLKAVLGDAVTLAGSFRRGSPLCGDVDALVAGATADAASERMRAAVNAMAASGYVVAELARGATKWQGIVRFAGLPARRMDLHAVGAGEHAFALLYFTGSREFNIELRARARGRGMRLSERALLSADGRRLRAATEHEIFALLNTPYIAPEHRVGRPAMPSLPPRVPVYRTPTNQPMKVNMRWFEDAPGVHRLRSVWVKSPVPPWMCTRVLAPGTPVDRKLPRGQAGVRALTNEVNALNEIDARWTVTGPRRAKSRVPSKRAAQESGAARERPRRVQQRRVYAPRE
jgi:DNA polymerase/3'-5' exonuclease PolX